MPGLMGFAPAIRSTAAHTEQWVVTFAGSTAAGLGTSSSKQYGTVYRVQGGQSVATGTLPFTLNFTEASMIIDIFINAAVVNGGDFQFDVEIANNSQKLFWDAGAMLFSSNSRPRLPAPGIPLPGNTQIAFAAYWIVAQSTTSTTNVFVLTRTQPTRGY
jgi:hypothetical protein